MLELQEEIRNLERMENFWNNVEKHFDAWNGTSRREFLMYSFGLNTCTNGYFSPLKALIKIGLHENDVIRYNAMCQLLDNLLIYLKQTTEDIDNFASLILYLSSDSAANELKSGQCKINTLSDKTAKVKYSEFDLENCSVMGSSMGCTPKELLAKEHVLSNIVGTCKGVQIYQVSMNSNEYVQVTDLRDLTIQYQRLFSKAKEKTLTNFERVVLTVMTEQIISKQTELPMIFLSEGLYKKSDHYVYVAGKRYRYDIDDCRMESHVEAIKGLIADIAYLKIVVPEKGIGDVQCFCIR